VNCDVFLRRTFGRKRALLTEQRHADLLRRIAQPIVEHCEQGMPARRALRASELRGLKAAPESWRSG